MKNSNTYKFLFTAALIGGSFAASAMETDQDKLDEQLRTASEKGNHNEVKRLLEKGANVNAKDLVGTTALRLAVHNKHSKVIQILIDAKANLNIPYEYGGTALMLACKSPECLRILIDAKANLDIQNRGGTTALMHACFEDNQECLHMLIDAKANLEIKDVVGWSALTWAARHNKPNNVSLLIEAGANIYALDNDESDALGHAFDCDSHSCVTLLVDAGADLRPTIRKHGWRWQTKALIQRSIEVIHQQTKSAYALLWCMKQCNQAQSMHTDILTEPFFAAHKEMLIESIELLPNENDKISLRAALYAEPDNDQSN